MLVMGVCNPAGERNTYNGLYFTGDELQELVHSGCLMGRPVKAEHKGEALGKIVSSFVDNSGKLNCVMKLNGSVEGSIAAGLVRDGIASELSLGYSVDVAHSQNGRQLQAGKKQVLEVSLVRKGARDACYVTAFEDEGKPTCFTRAGEQKHALASGTDLAANPWATFALGGI
jgi:hypothetical protein